MSRQANRQSKLSNIAARAQANVDSIQRSESERSPSRRIEVAQITPSPYQARRDFSNLAPLTEDIRQHGVLQPVLVRPLGSERYELVAGERRWRASQEAGLSKIPAVVREMTDHEALVFGLSENLQREDLNAYEVARAVADLAAAELEQPVDAVRQALSSKRPDESVLRAMDKALGLLNKELTLRTYQRHYLPLLSLPTHLIDAIEQGASYLAVLSLRGATAEQQQEWLPRVISGEWTTRQVEAAMKEARQGQQPALVPRDAYDWGGKAKELRGVVTEARLRKLDGRQQRKARRLMEQLADLMKDAEG